ncbi:hypothetical protein LEMLEM_LOCUS20290, partial [Lemmus lemmus]
MEPWAPEPGFSTTTLHYICLNANLYAQQWLWWSLSIYLRVKRTGCPSSGPEFDSHQPRGGSQPSLMRSGSLFWCAGIDGGRML